MGIDGSLPGSKEGAACFDSEPDKFSPRLLILLTYYLFWYYASSTPSSFIYSLSFSLPHKNCVRISFFGQ